LSSALLAHSNLTAGWVAVPARPTVALFSSILLHVFLLSWIALPKPIEGEHPVLTVLLRGLAGSETETVNIPERPNTLAPAPPLKKTEPTPAEEALPPLARVKEPETPAPAAPERTTATERTTAPERAAAPIPPEPRAPSRKPYVNAQMTTVPPGVPEAPEGYIRQEDLERAPEPLNPIVARYPGAAVSAGRTGHVIAELLLSAEGSVVSVNPWQPEQAELVLPAVEALQNARFRPAERSGETVPARVYYVVLFTLE
jgi:outer membrane biosynthesis protein TonB